MNDRLSGNLSIRAALSDANERYVVAPFFVSRSRYDEDTPMSAYNSSLRVLANFRQHVPTVDSFFARSRSYR